ncbi:ATP-binding protein [Chloroflexota bacterium]
MSEEPSPRDKEHSELMRASEQRRLQQQSRLPSGTRGTHRLSTFVESPGNADAYRAARYYAGLDKDLTPFDSECIEARNLSHHFITFYGNPGTGKTHLALAIAWEKLLNNTSVLYWQAEEFLDALRHSFNVSYGDATQTILKHVKQVRIMVLDDLGAHQSTGWALAKLDAIIDYRYINQRLTVFTTNVSPMELPARIASRLAEGQVCGLKGDDYRRIKAKRPEIQGG